MSRRGRPRKQDALLPTARAAQSRSTRIAAGAKRFELMLAPEVASQLDALSEHLKESRSEVISQLVRKAARRVLG